MPTRATVGVSPRVPRTFWGVHRCQACRGMQRQVRLPCHAETGTAALPCRDRYGCPAMQRQVRLPCHAETGTAALPCSKCGATQQGGTGMPSNGKRRVKRRMVAWSRRRRASSSRSRTTACSRSCASSSTCRRQSHAVVSLQLPHCCFRPCCAAGALCARARTGSQQCGPSSGGALPETCQTGQMSQVRQELCK